ncbi:hypothetical protein Tco_1413895 [Tanacetum coccineum]
MSHPLSVSCVIVSCCSADRSVSPVKLHRHFSIIKWLIPLLEYCEQLRLELVGKTQVVLRDLWFRSSNKGSLLHDVDSTKAEISVG